MNAFADPLQQSAARVILAIAGVASLLPLAGCSKNGDQAVLRDPNLATFANSKDTCPKEWLDHYVDFSFQYPKSWKVTPGNTNYVQVDSVTPAEMPRPGTSQSFSVGQYWLNASTDLRASLARAAGQMSDNWAAQLPEYRKLSEVPCVVAGISGYEFRFSCRFPKEDVQVWTRQIIVPNRSGIGDGVLIGMIFRASPPNFASAEDIDTKTEFPTILKSLRIGK